MKPHCLVTLRGSHHSIAVILWFTEMCCEKKVSIQLFKLPDMNTSYFFYCLLKEKLFHKTDAWLFPLNMNIEYKYFKTQVAGNMVLAN